MDYGSIQNALTDYPQTDNLMGAIETEHQKMLLESVFPLRNQGEDVARFGDFSACRPQATPGKFQRRGHKGGPALCVKIVEASILKEIFNNEKQRTR